MILLAAAALANEPTGLHVGPGASVRLVEHATAPCGGSVVDDAWKVTATAPCEIDGSRLMYLRAEGTVSSDVVLQALQRIEAVGDGDVTLSVGGAAEPLSIEVTGTGDVAVTGIGAAGLTVVSKGPGNVVLAGPGGAGGTLVLELADRGRLDAGGWVVGAADVALADEATAAIGVTGVVAGTVAGAAHLDVNGTLDVVVDTSETGAVSWSGPAAPWTRLVLAQVPEAVIVAGVPAGHVEASCARGGRLRVGSAPETPGTLDVAGLAPGCTVLVPPGSLADLFAVGGVVRAAVGTTVPALDSLHAVDADVELGRVEATGLVVSVQGRGDVSIADLDARDVSVDVAGTGDVTLAGTAGSASLACTAAGSVRAAGLALEYADVTLSSTGDADIHATRGVSAAVTGEGAVLTVAGGARVKRRGRKSGEIREIP